MSFLRKVLSLICASFISLFSKCTYQPNRKVNKLFECNFKEEKNNIFYFLLIKNISKKQFILANGLNVVEDIIEETENKYYSVKLWTVERETNFEIQYDFQNLKDKYPDGYKIPNLYEDDNGNTLAPVNSSNTSDNFYKITYNNINFTFKGDNDYD